MKPVMGAVVAGFAVAIVLMPLTADARNYDYTRLSSEGGGGGSAYSAMPAPVGRPDGQLARPNTIESMNAERQAKVQALREKRLAERQLQRERRRTNSASNLPDNIQVIPRRSGNTYEVNRQTGEVTNQQTGAVLGQNGAQGAALNQAQSGMEQLLPPELQSDFAIMERQQQQAAEQHARIMKNAQRLQQ